MERPHEVLFDVQSLTNLFAQIERNHYIAGTETHENDSEHSLTVALLSWCIVEQYDLDLNLEKVLKYALCHDLPEVYAGDVNTFATAELRQEKAVKEEAAKLKLTSEFIEFPSLVDAIYAYDEKADSESIFVWTVDKMQQLIMGELDQWRPYRELGITYEAFEAKYKELLSKCSPYCREIFSVLIEHCKSTYYDQPEQKRDPKIS